jgi:glycosyltransferase involved in cell wall biosynthesis
MRSPRGHQLLVVAWDRFQPRSVALAAALRGEARHIRGDWPGRHPALLPLRYLADAVRMWRTLRREQPGVLLVVSPPIGPPMVGWLWCRLHHCRLVVDCHTSAFHLWKWRWTIPIHKRVFAACAAVLVHTEGDAAQVRSWGFQPILLPDDLPDTSQAGPPPAESVRPRVLVAGSLEWDEPVAATLEAARLLPDVEFRLTGNLARLAPGVQSSAPANAIFTGYLAYPQFLGEMVGANAVAVFTTDVHIMNRAAFETIGLGRPLVLSDLAQLRTRFSGGGLFCANDPAAMAAAVSQALEQEAELAARSRALQGRLREQREAALTELRHRLELTPAAAPAMPAASVS